MSHSLTTPHSIGNGSVSAPMGGGHRRRQARAAVLHGGLQAAHSWRGRAI